MFRFISCQVSSKSIRFSKIISIVSVRMDISASVVNGLTDRRDISVNVTKDIRGTGRGGTPDLLKTKT